MTQERNVDFEARHLRFSRTVIPAVLEKAAVLLRFPKLNEDAERFRVELISEQMFRRIMTYVCLGDLVRSNIDLKGVNAQRIFNDVYYCVNCARYAYANYNCFLAENYIADLNRANSQLDTSLEHAAAVIGGDIVAAFMLPDAAVEERLLSFISSVQS